MISNYVLEFNLVISVPLIPTVDGVKPLKDVCLEVKNTLFVPLPVLTDGTSTETHVKITYKECS